MTPTNDAPVTVEQVDRKLYALIAPDMCALILDGELDQHRELQAIARHRLAALASAPAGDGVERELTPMLIASARGHLANVKAHGNAEANACIVFEAVLDAAAALARPRAAVGEQSREAPNTITYNPVYRVTYEGSDPSRGYVYALQAPPAKVEG